MVKAEPEQWQTFFDLQEVMTDGAEWPDYIAVIKKEVNQSGEVQVIGTRTYGSREAPIAPVPGH